MGFGQGLGGFNEGLGNGVSLYNALQMAPLQRQRAQIENQQAQQQLADLQNRIPTQINGQTFNLPMMSAAQYQEQLAEKEMQAKIMQAMMQGRMGMQQSFQAAKLTDAEQNKLDAARSAVPIHNAALALGQAWATAQSGDPSATNLAMTTAKEALAKSPTLAPFAASLGNDPSNIPKLYDSVIGQGAIEQNKLSTGSIRPIPPSEIAVIKNQFYPSLAQFQSSPDVAYGMFKHFSDAYITPAYESAENHLLQGSNGDPSNPQFENPTTANTYARVKQQHEQTMAQLYQMPGFGPKGTPVPEMQGAIPGLSTNGAPLPGAGPQGGGLPIPGLGGASLPTAPVTPPSAALPTIPMGSKPMPMRTKSGVQFQAL